MLEKIPKHFEISLVLLILIPALLYIHTVSFDYALDDRIVILENEHTKKGVKGIQALYNKDSFSGFFKDDKARVEGGRYRPLSLITFALEWQISPNNPGLSHMINVLLYILTGILLFLILQELIPPKKDTIFHVAFIASLLFLCHPIHTEVVANIKGRDEILGLLLSFLSFYIILKNIHRFHIMSFLLSGIIMYLAMLAKENSITYIGIFPALLYLFKGQEIKSTGKEKTWKKHLLYLSPILLGAIFYLIKRAIVFQNRPDGEIDCILLNDPFCGMEFMESLPSIIHTWAKYIYLLFFPSQLTHDYYPFVFEYPNWSSSQTWMSISVIAVFLLPFILAIKQRKKQKAKILIAAYVLILIPFSIVSNLFFNIGTLMNERFIYASSIGFCLILGLALQHLFEKKYKLSVIWSLLIIIGLYGHKTIDRSKAWENDFTLAQTDIKTSVNSIKCNTFYGGILLEQYDTIADPKSKESLLEIARMHLNKAIQLSPNQDHITAWNLLGNSYSKEDQLAKAIEIYAHCNQKFGASQLVLENILYVYQRAVQIEKFEIAIKAKEQLIRYKSKPQHFNDIAQVYGQFLGDPKMAAFWLEKGYELYPNDIHLIENLGVVFGILKDFDKSIKYLSKAIELNPKQAQNYRNLSITFLNKGDKETAKRFELQYLSLKDSE